MRVYFLQSIAICICTCICFVFEPVFAPGCIEITSPLWTRRRRVFANQGCRWWGWFPIKGGVATCLSAKHLSNSSDFLSCTKWSLSINLCWWYAFGGISHINQPLCVKHFSNIEEQLSPQSIFLINGLFQLLLWITAVALVLAEVC